MSLVHRDADGVHLPDDFEPLDQYAAEDALYLTEHPRRCGCRDCDPDTYNDPAERDELESGWRRGS